MENIDDFYDKQLKKIDALSPCQYRVARYTLSHKQLIILVESKREDMPQKLFIVFEGVDYMQLFSSWEDTPIKLAIPTERNSFLHKAKFSISEGNPPHVFYALPQNKDIFVICSRMYVDEKMPKLYEYTFS